MLWGVDSAYPHNAPEQLAQLGYSFACGYIGGRALHVWTPDDWRRHATAGLRLAPIWVSPSTDTGRSAGASDGNAALDAMHTAGLSGLVIADIEDGATPAEWYLGFTDALHNGQCASGLYGSSQTLRALGNLADTWWLAAWVAQGMPLGQSLPDWSMWQFAEGPSFDYNVARDDFPFAGIAL